MMACAFYGAFWLVLLRLLFWWGCGMRYPILIKRPLVSATKMTVFDALQLAAFQHPVNGERMHTKHTCCLLCGQAVIVRNFLCLKLVPHGDWHWWMLYRG